MSYHDIIDVEWFSHSSGEIRMLYARIGTDWFKPHSGRGLKKVGVEGSLELEERYIKYQHDKIDKHSGEDYSD